jgi:RimJ/RimL family protein N-acetyltransferase
MTNQEDSSTALRHHREQMLKLISKSFYKELINYGVNTHEILTVTEHLLDSLQSKSEKTNGNAEYYRGLFSIKDVGDEWAAKKRLTMQEVSISPLDPALIPRIAAWLKEPGTRESFYPSFPELEDDLGPYFQVPSREYFSISYEQSPVGIIGAENIDTHSAKLEMRKLVGDPGMHGKGIGKRATFLFLYYAFVTRGFRKVYLHSMDVNIRNINLNSKFGFELEGLLVEDFKVRDQWRDVLRMSLTRALWMELFSGVS